MVTCPNCNKLFDDNARFCDNCGIELPKVGLCAKCGNPTSPESTFCKSCGAPLNEAPAGANIENPLTPQEPVMPSAPPEADLYNPTSAQEPVAQPAPTDVNYYNPVAVQEPIAPPAPPEVNFYSPAADTTSTDPSLHHEFNITEQTKTEKKKLKKWIGVCAACVVLVAALVVVGLFVFGGKSAKNYALLLKDNELHYTEFSKNGSLQVSSDLADFPVDELKNPFSNLRSFILLSKNGNVLFYPDRLEEDSLEDGELISDGINLYYRYLNKPKEEPVKIDSEVKAYVVNDSSTMVTYTKGEDESLYQYNLLNNEKTKLADSISDLFSSENGDSVVYVVPEDGAYLKRSKKDKVKIDSDVDYLVHVSKDLSTVYYIKDDALYKKTEGKEKVKIASQVYRVLAAYDSGEIYYVKDFSEEVSLMNFVVDDMKDYDANIKMPERPVAPSWWDYYTYEAYEAAYAAFNKAYDEYVNAYEKYLQKEGRDYLREDLSEETIEYEKYALCYYNGSEEKIITETFGLNSYLTAADAATIVYKAYNPSSFEKIKLSEIKYSYEVEDIVEKALYSSSEIYVAIKDAASVMEQKEAEYIHINDKGDTIFFVDNVSYDKYSGNLYKITISGGKVQQTELYDTDVHESRNGFLKNGQFYYFKNYKDIKGELYLDKTLVDYDVFYGCYDMSEYGNFEGILYFADYNIDKSYGTLKQYKNGKSIKISDEVYDFEVTPKGDIVYINSYSIHSSKGELHLYNGKKSEKIGDDVTYVLTNLDLPYRGKWLYDR